MFLNCSCRWVRKCLMCKQCSNVVEILENLGYVEVGKKGAESLVEGEEIKFFQNVAVNLP